MSMLEAVIVEIIDLLILIHDGGSNYETIVSDLNHSTLENLCLM